MWRTKPLLAGERNQRLFLINYLFACVGLGLCGEGYIQAFLLSAGMDLKWIGSYGVAMNLASLGGYAAFSLLHPAQGGYKRWTLWFSAAVVVYPLGMLIASFMDLTLLPARLFACAIGILYALASSFKASSEFCLTPSLFDRSAYANLLGKGGVIGGVLAFLISMANAVLLRDAGEMTGYRIFFALALVALAISAGLVAIYRPTPGRTGGAAPARLSVKDVASKLTQWRYVRLLIPHFLRGVGGSGMYYFVAIAFGGFSLTASQNAAIAIIGVCGGIVGNFLFMRLIVRFRSGVMTLIANAVCGMCAVLATVNGHIWAAFALYLVYWSSNVVSQTSIPTGVMRSTPDADMPFISSMRMFVFSGASCIFIPLFGKLIERSPLWAMMVAAAAFIAAGVVYMRQLRDVIET